VEEELKLPILASFPKISKTALSSIGSLATLSPSVRPLLDLRFCVLEKLSNKAEKGVITVVSLRRGEGKSTLVRGLGYSLAHGGKRVLLLDLNVFSPVLNKLFGQSPSPGIGALLAEKVSLEETVRPTGHSNLALIPCEPSHGGLAGRLDSTEMRSLIKSLQKNFDIVLIDTPSLASGPEGFILSSRADGVLFVAVPQKTPKSLAKEAQERLQSLGATPVGIVLNKVKV
jgi:capsular exopolysaccharide synthesis family protein